MELLILTYHYVDDPRKYKAGIYPVSPENFRGQVDKLGEKYEFISESDLVSALDGKTKLPDRSCFLTFDDGLKCQYEKVVPILAEKKIPAAFFIPTQHLENGSIYITHKIHLLLAAVPAEELLKKSEKYSFNITGQQILWSDADVNHIRSWYIYDDLPTAKFKFMLNHRLDPVVAAKITERLFGEYYSGQEEAVCKSFFMSREDLKSLVSSKLFSIGLHTHTHLDMARAGTDLIVADLRKNHEILSGLVGRISGISYPFGLTPSSDIFAGIVESLVGIGLKYGLTTKKGLNEDTESRFALKRYNPNDIEKLPTGI